MENLKSLSKEELERQLKLYEGFLEEDEVNIKELREKVAALKAEYNRRYGTKGGIPDEAFRV